MMPAEKRTSRGRQKIEIKRIEKASARQVCFTKRRGGLFNKATELSVMCGAEIAIIAFSASGKAYSFGHPSFDSVANRFLSGVVGNTLPKSSAAGAMAVSELDRRCREMEERLEVARRMKGVLEAQLRKKSGALARLLNGKVEEMRFEDAVGLASAMERLNLDAQRRVEQLVVDQRAMITMVAGDTSNGVGRSFAGFTGAAENMMAALPPLAAEVNTMMDALPPQGGGSFLAAEEKTTGAFPHLDGGFFSAPPRAEENEMAGSPLLDDGFLAAISAAEENLMVALPHLNDVFLAAHSAADENTIDAHGGFFASPPAMEHNMMVALPQEGVFAASTAAEDIMMAVLSPPWDFDYD